MIFKGQLQQYALHNPESALATYRTAVSANPALAAGHAAIISLLIEKRDLVAAKAQLEQLKAAQPNRLETRLFEAQLAYLGNDYAKTREITEQLLKRLPNDPRI